MNKKSGVKPGKVNQMVRCANCRHWEAIGETFKCFGHSYRIGWCHFEETKGKRETTGDCERCENFSAHGRTPKCRNYNCKDWINNAFGCTHNRDAEKGCHAFKRKGKPNADLERTARSDGTLQDFVGDSK